jgi:GMP synthase (glutamine-hydrolysing)
MKGVSENSQVWMSHGDTISSLPKEFSVLASTLDVNIAAYSFSGSETYGLQFHPEVYHSKEGTQILSNFLLDICKCSQDWTADSFIDSTVKSLKNKLKQDKVVLGLSGGVDSTVAAVLLQKAIGDNLSCIFVDNGLLRKGEYKILMLVIIFILPCLELLNLK